MLTGIRHTAIAAAQASASQRPRTTPAKSAGRQLAKQKDPQKVAGNELNDIVETEIARV